jgi:general secretion pathway protein G
LEGGLQLFHYDVGRYPTTSEGLSALVRNPNTSVRWLGPYLQRAHIPSDPWGRPYLFRCRGRHGVYDLFSYGADGVEGGSGESADITSWESAKPRPESKH